MNGASTDTTTGPDGYQSSRTVKFNSIYTLRKGETQVSDYSDRYQCSFAGVTFSFRYKYQYANGELRVFINDYECTPIN